MNINEVNVPRLPGIPRIGVVGSSGSEITPRTVLHTDREIVKCHSCAVQTVHPGLEIQPASFGPCRNCGNLAESIGVANEPAHEIRPTSGEEEDI